MSKKDEEAAAEWAKDHWEKERDQDPDLLVLMRICGRAGFLSGCSHKEKQYEGLVEISGQCVAAYKAKAEELWACFDQLDEILKEVGDGK